MFIPNWTMPHHTLVVDRRCAFIAVSLLRHRQHPRQELGPVLPQETGELSGRNLGQVSYLCVKVTDVTCYTLIDDTYDDVTLCYSVTEKRHSESY